MARSELTRTNITTGDIVAKLWNLSKALQGAGISYQGYITELTFLLFLKMLEETKHEDRLPSGRRWSDLAKRTGLDQLEFYRRMLLDLGNEKITKDPLVRAIFTDAQTNLRKPTDLKLLTTTIDQLDWFSARDDGLGDLYEGLLEKTTSEKKSKAGQYFTPRPLIDCIVRLVKPQPGEVIQDPAAGTAGFLVAADRYIKDAADDLFKLSKDKAHFQRKQAFVGAEFVPDTRRLCLMNLQLHGVEIGVDAIDSLSSDGESLGKADVILINPPFNKMPQTVSRSDFSITADERVGPIPFVEHVVRSLKPGGRAAVVVPDNVLFADGVGLRLRQWLMNLCDLHTILRLPTGIFYAQGVKTNVLFFARGKIDTGNTKSVWVYDLRANMPTFGKTRPLTAQDFAPFEKAFGSDPLGKSKRKDEGEQGRFRCFTRKQIEDRDFNLNISWLKDTNSGAEEGLTEPDDITDAMILHLKTSLGEIERLSEALKENTGLRSAFKGDLTEDWREARSNIESVSELLKRVPAPEQPRGGREATEAVIPGVAALSVNNPQTQPPTGWQWTPLLRVARQETGHTPSRSKSNYWNGGIPWIGIKDANIHHGKVITETLQTITRKGLENSSARLLPAGTVCLSRTASVGYITIMGRPMATSQDFATWTCTPALLPKFLMYALMAEGDDIRNFGEGSTHTTIYFPEIRALHICLPPIEEQAEIVRRVEKALAWVDKISAEHGRIQQLLPKLDQAILAKAFRGELVPHVAQTQSVSASQKPVKAQRGTVASTRSGRTRQAQTA